MSCIQIALLYGCCWIVITHGYDCHLFPNKIMLKEIKEQLKENKQKTPQNLLITKLGHEMFWGSHERRGDYFGGREVSRKRG